MIRQTINSLQELVSDWGFLDRPRLLLEDQTGLWLFFWARDGSLGCTNSVDGGKNWSAKEILIKDFSGEIAAAKNSKGYLVLAFTDQEYNLHLWQWDGRSWRINIIGKPPEEILRQLTLAVDSNDHLHLIYIAYPSGNPQDLSYFHLFQQNGQWSAPHLIDQAPLVSGNQPAFCLTDQGALHLVYPYREEQLRLRYRRWEENSWSPAVELTDAKTNNLYPNLILDKQGDLQLVWLASDGKHTRVYGRTYKDNPGWISGGWQEPQPISTEGFNCYSPVLWNNGEKVYCLWQQINGVFIAGRDHDGYWQKPFYSPWLAEFLKIFNSKRNTYRLHTPECIWTSFGKAGRQLSSFPASLKKLALSPEASANDQILSIFRQANEFANKEVWINIDKTSYSFTTFALFELLQKIFFEIEDLNITIEQMDQTLTFQTEKLLDLEAGLKQKELLLQQLGQHLATKDRVIHALQSSLQRISED